MINVIIHFYIKQPSIDSFITLTTGNVADRRKAPGNLAAELFQQEDDPAHFILIETFDTQATIDTYYESTTYLEWHSSTQNMIDRIEGADFRKLS